MPERIPVGLRCLCLALLMEVFIGSATRGAEFTLAEPATDARVFSVRSRLTVEGSINTSSPGMPPSELRMKVDGKLSYLERRIAPAGKDADSLRSVRYYQVADAAIDVAGRQTVNQLPESSRIVVAEGHRSGLRLWNPQTRMTRETIELLRSPGDSLALIGVLPKTAVASGATWQPEYWVLPLLTGVEAISKNRFDCRLEKVDSQFAVIALDGEIEGAIHGAITKIAVTGQVAWDLQGRYIRQAKVTQTEERAVGAVSPGMKVTATMYVDRQPSAVAGALTDELTASIPVNPDPELLALTFDTAGGVRVVLDRNWHVFHQNAEVAVLRLVEDGSLIAQCNVSSVPTVAAGSHTPDEAFVADIRTALGGQLQKLESAETLKSPDGLRLYRVIASGQARNVALHWLYYLCTAPDGRQTAFVFSVESQLLDRLAGRDRAIVESIQFAASPQPRPASPAVRQTSGTTIQPGRTAAAGPRSPDTSDGQE